MAHQSFDEDSPFFRDHSKRFQTSASIRVHLRLTVFRKEENMNNEIIVAIAIAVAIVAAIIAAAKFPKFRHAFIVPEGYPGLLYHKGKFSCAGRQPGPDEPAPAAVAHGGAERG
jgi:hypothetical protein